MFILKKQFKSNNMRPENTNQTRLAIVVCLILISMLLMTVSVCGQCDPYKSGPYTKQDVYIAPVIPLLGTFISVEYAHNNGASRAQRDRVAATGFIVIIATCAIDYKIKQYKKRRKVSRIYPH
jgi:hypothetical protein